MKVTFSILIAALAGTIYLLTQSASPAGKLREAASDRATALEEAQAMIP